MRAVARFQSSVDNEVLARVVDRIPPLAAQQAALGSHAPLHHIERGDGSAEVLARVGPGLNRGLGAVGIFQVESHIVAPHGREAVVVELHAEIIGLDLIAVGPDLREFEVAAKLTPVAGEEGPVVDETALHGVLHAEQRGRDDRNARIADYDRVDRRQLFGPHPEVQADKSGSKNQ